MGLDHLILPEVRKCSHYGRACGTRQMALGLLINRLYNEEIVLDYLGGLNLVT